jgi:hypothetical protein
MYWVMNSKDDVIAICSRQQDAAAFLDSNLDKDKYRIVGEPNERDNHLSTVRTGRSD